MAVAEVVGGSQTATITTEHTLTTQTTPNVYVLVVDLVNLVGIEVVELRLKTKVRSGDALQQAYYARFQGVQEDDNVYSVPVPANVEIVATLKQLNGTGRVFKWALLSL